MEDREVPGRMGEPVDEERLRWLAVIPGPALGRSLA